jgi:glycosyltransferase involved in cell wall biosynthesis
MLGGNRNAIFIDKTINRLAKRIVVCSNAAKAQMVNNENVDPEKICMIKLGYNFDLYPKPDPLEVGRIKTQMACKLLLIVVSRMTPNKNNIQAAQVLIDLCKKGLDVKMIMMDEGPEKQKILDLIKTNGMEDRIFFTGFVKNTMDYLQAADLLLHPSFSEASNQVVKEAGFLFKPSIVCKDVGDFEEYIINGKNGWTVAKNEVVKQMEALVEKYYSNTDDLKKMGAEMHNTIIGNFPIDPVCEKYLELALN